MMWINCQQLFRTRHIISQANCPLNGTMLVDVCLMDLYGLEFTFLLVYV